jgi:hypothetical protein
MNNLLLKDEKGVVLIVTVIIMITLIAVTVAFLYMISIRIKGAGHDARSSQAFWCAEGGVQYGCFAVREDRDAVFQTSDPTVNGYSDAVYLEGYLSAGQFGSNFDRASFHGTSSTDATPYYAVLTNVIGAYVQVWDFQQRFNLMGTRIKELEVVVRARKNAVGGGNPRIRLQYSINGGTTWNNVGPPINVAAVDWEFRSYSFRDALNPNQWDFFINSNNTRFRAYRENAGARECWIDWLALRVTVEVDALTEPWGSGSYQTFPLTLGSGTIESVSISDESGKLHLNYAGQDILQYLAEESGFTLAEAAAFAQDVIDYRVTKFFDYVEELMQLSSMTEELLNLIKDYVTVYSWVNNQVTRPAGSRAPVNINTADSRVLRAIFRTVMTSEQAIDLADVIITQRAITPFTHAYSTRAFQDADSRSFLSYLDNLSALTVDEFLALAENADASFYNLTLTSSWNGNDELATEFCYYSNAFLVTALGEDGTIQRTVRTVYGEPYDYTSFYPDSTGTFALPAYIGQTAPAYWREMQE